MKSALAWLASFLLAPGVLAQSYNLDLAPNQGGFGPPSTSHGAAAFQPGFWNEFQTVDVLDDVSGGGTFVKAVSGGTGATFVAVDNPATSGDDHALLDDGIRLTGGTALWNLHVATLSPGTYLVYTYVLAPDHAGSSTVEVTPSSTPIQTAGGAWPGAHAEGVTYTRHLVELASCCLIVRVRPQVDQGFVAGLQIVRIADSMTATCPGTAAACPCGNGGAGGAGCANSTGGGATLAGSGAPLVAGDTLTLTANGTPATATVLFFEGSAPIAAVFSGDGLRCAGGNLVRLGARTASAGSASFPGPQGPAISSVTFPQPGEQRVYQAWYRDPAAFCTAATFNLTSALEVTWR